MIDLTKFKPQLVGCGNMEYFLFNQEVVALEPKIDGVRCILHKKGSEVRLYSRTGVEYTKRFSAVLPALKEACLADEIILDGELAVVHNGKITTASVALRKELDPDMKRVFFAFDCILIDGQELMQYPLMTRKQHLQLFTADNDHFTLVPSHCVDNKDDVLEFYKKAITHFEGIVLKSLKPYCPNSRYHWLKLKPVKTLDLSVVKKEVTKDNKMFLYTLEGEGVALNRVISSIDAPVGSLVEVCYEPYNERMKFPRILRVRDESEK